MTKVFNSGFLSIFESIDLNLKLNYKLIDSDTIINPGNQLNKLSGYNIIFNVNPEIINSEWETLIKLNRVFVRDEKYIIKDVIHLPYNEDSKIELINLCDSNLMKVQSESDLTKIQYLLLGNRIALLNNFDFELDSSLFNKLKKCFESR